MHNKSLLLQFASAVLVFESISIHAQTVTPSTNYVATGQRLLVTGSGFATNEVINVFVSPSRVPSCEIRTDSNGCFNADITYGGPYASTNVLYRFNPDVEGSAYYVSAFYQAAEAPRFVGLSDIVYANEASIDDKTPMATIKITQQVGPSGAQYDVATSTNVNGPWHLMNMAKPNGTTGNVNIVWDFEVPQGAQRYFRIVGNPME